MQKIGFCDKYSLTQAVLNGTKTMTRRVEKGLETFEFDYEVHFFVRGLSHRLYYVHQLQQALRLLNTNKEIVL